MAGMSYNPPASMGGIVRATKPTAARGASAMNARAREKTAAFQNNKAQTVDTGNNVPGVAPIAGPNPIRQPAYETQAQTLMDQRFQGEQAGLDRTHQQTSQANEAAARLKEQEAAAAAQRGEMELAARLSQEAEARRLSSVTRIMSSSGATAPQVDGSGGPAGNEEAARTAAFARAKERAGQTALASINALKDVMAGNGQMGSSMEASGLAGLVGGAAGDINEFSRDEMILDTNRAADVADRNYAGGITQRGQDLAMKQSLISLLGKSGAY